MHVEASSGSATEMRSASASGTRAWRVFPHGPRSIVPRHPVQRGDLVNALGVASLLGSHANRRRGESLCPRKSGKTSFFLLHHANWRAKGLRRRARPGLITGRPADALGRPLDGRVRAATIIRGRKTFIDGRQRGHTPVVRIRRLRHRREPARCSAMRMPSS